MDQTNLNCRQWADGGGDKDPGTRGKRRNHWRGERGWLLEIGKCKRVILNIAAYSKKKI
jgi:hypothetical protein